MPLALDAENAPFAPGAPDAAFAAFPPFPLETANGVIEDERFNRPAKDGDRYTQEGIYTISVSNRYTGESTTKTIFVGSQELLETYVRNGFSLERLK